MSNWRTYNTLNLTGSLHDSKSVQGIVSEHKFQEKDPFEISFWNFLNDWFNPNIDFIFQKTSGSTGQAKIIRIFKQNMVNSAKSTIDFFGLKKDDKALLCISPDFIGGKMMIVRSIVAELELNRLKPSLNPFNNTENIETDFCAMVPSQLYASFEDIKKNKIKTLIIGGAPVDRKFFKKLEDLETEVYATFGMTETISHIALRKLNNPYSENYEVLPNISIEQDERDCLVINAPLLCKEKLFTNDIVDLISENQFVWKGRFDFVINSGGVKLHPEELENKIAECLAEFTTEQFVISSLVDEKWGEAMVLVIQKSGGEGEEKKKESDFKTELSQYLRQVLKPIETPKKIIFIEEIPKTPNGKIQRRELKNIIRSRDDI